MLFYLHKKQQDKSYKIMTLFLGLDAVNELVCHIYGILFPFENLIMAHTHYQLHFLFGSLLFYNLIATPVKKAIIFITFFYYVFTIYDFYTNPLKLYSVNFTEVFVISLILITYSLYYLYTIIDKEQKYVYFTLGLMLYLTCSSVVFFSGNIELVLCQKPYIDIWIFNSIFMIIYQLLIWKDWKSIIKKHGK